MQLSLKFICYATYGVRYGYNSGYCSVLSGEVLTQGLEVVCQSGLHHLSLLVDEALE
jgi:hypothetical protein